MSERLSQAYPSFAFVGEESYKAGETRVTNVPTFIVDPIDGTTNFVHGFPEACISLGLAVDRTPVVGVVYNPFRDEREFETLKLPPSLFYILFNSFRARV